MKLVEMNKDINRCPVCSSEIDKNEVEFCPTCSWELISIPMGASEWLKNHYSRKLTFHSNQFSLLKSGEQEIIKLNEANKALSLKLGEAEKVASEVSAAKNNLKKSITEKEEMMKRINYYREKYGDSWVGGGQTKENKITTAIKWEIIAELKFRFVCHHIQSVFPSLIVMLLKKNSRPTADGDFNFAFMLDTNNKKLIDQNTIELSIANNELKSGKYFTRFTNLNFHTNNILFFHKDQGSVSSSFDWDKTIINI